MGILDAQLQYIIFSIILPAAMIFIIIRWYFDLKFVKIRTWVEAKWLIVTHKRLKNEKKLLFGHLNRMGFGDKLSRRQKSIPLHILEIGVGAGRNFDFYPERAIVTCLDPNSYQESYIKQSIKDAKKRLKFNKFVKGFAEDMKGIEDNTFDIVICTLSLCTVRNPDAALQEVRRVLKPGGKFLFLEHVASPKRTLTRWIQDRIQKVWGYVTGGCHLNCETCTYLDRADFSEVSYQHFNLEFGLVRSWIYGIATK